jgi:hypothetical protein
MQIGQEEEAKIGHKTPCHVGIKFALCCNHGQAHHLAKCLYGQDYDYNVSPRVVGAALWMQKAHLQKKVAKLGKVKDRLVVEKPWIRDTICDLFHIGHDAYSQIVGSYLHNCKVDVSGENKSGRARNSTAKESRMIPQTSDANRSARFCSWPSILQDRSLISLFNRSISSFLEIHLAGVRSFLSTWYS